MNQIAKEQQACGHYAVSEALYEQALKLVEGSDETAAFVTAALQNNLGEVYRTQACLEEAGRLFRRSLAMYRTALGPEHTFVAVVLNNWAELLRAQGQYAEAEVMYQPKKSEGRDVQELTRGGERACFALPAMDSLASSSATMK